MQISTPVLFVVLSRSKLKYKINYLVFRLSMQAVEKGARQRHISDNLLAKQRCLRNLKKCSSTGK